MKYLSIDIEATGLKEDCLIIEFGCVPFDTQTKTIEDKLSFHMFVQCPSFESLKETLDPWVVENNEKLIRKAHSDGLALPSFKLRLEEYLRSEAIKNYFAGEKIILFGKSMNAIDLPFLNRDLGWDWMRDNFHFRVLDLSSYTLGLIDMGKLPKGADSGSFLMKYFEMGDVEHTALADAKNTAIMYLKLLEKFSV